MCPGIEIVSLNPSLILCRADGGGRGYCDRPGRGMPLSSPTIPASSVNRATEQKTPQCTRVVNDQRSEPDSTTPGVI